MIELGHWKLKCQLQYVCVAFDAPVKSSMDIH